jgi:hypothetical protein
VGKGKPRGRRVAPLEEEEGLEPAQQASLESLQASASQLEADLEPADQEASLPAWASRLEEEEEASLQAWVQEASLQAWALEPADQEASLQAWASGAVAAVGYQCS